ncbi:MAG: hypothetical protein Q7R79_00820 [bacterium]|nr:hypothetical protein [bacterium]
MAQLKATVGGAKGLPIEGQFQSLIDQHAKDGWEYYALENLHAQVSAGCLASLMGKKDEVLFQDVVVFRKPKS